jgi:hypothetical protein
MKLDTFCGCRPQYKRILTGRACDRERASVRPLRCSILPLAGMVVRGSGPNLEGELVGSGCPTGFPDPDLFDHFAHAGRRRLTPPAVPASGFELQLHQQAAIARAGSL